MSEVERLFAKLQEQIGGNLTWHQLHPQQQHQFIAAVNFILHITSLKANT